MWTKVLIVVCALVALSHALTHPDFIKMHHRGGRVYQQAKSAHDTLMRDNGIYYNTTPNTFQQWLNHSNPAAGAFSQRYWVDYSAWNAANGTYAMLYINGEAPASSSPTGYAAVYGHQKNAILFTLENRYYGESMPGPLTDQAKLMQYLNVDFALEDLRNFMRFAESEQFLNRTFRWFIVGGSYSGALSAWFKQKYPSAVLASWSSSGVVQAQLNFYDYDGHVGAELQPVCVQAIRNVLQIFEDMWDSSPETRQQLFEIFNVTLPFLKEDMSYMLADAAAGAVQYGMKFDLCNAIVPQNTTDPLGQYQKMIADLWGNNFAGCYYSTACLANASMSQYWAGAGYSWTYQTCSQMAYFQVGYYKSVRLPDVSTDYFINQCRGAFGPTIFPDVYSFNAKYGGLTPHATNVIALQGSDDPWSTTGVRTSLGINYPAVIADCEGCGHCGDLMTPSALDPPSLVAQRGQIAHYMDIWLSSIPTSYQLVLNGNFSFIVNNSVATAAFSEAITLDIRAAIDQSVIVTSLACGSLIVNFTLEVNALNSAIVTGNAQIASQSTSWLVNTQAAFTEFGGQGTFSIASISGGGITQAPGTLTPAASTTAVPSTTTASGCDTGCIVGASVGSIAAVVVIAVIVLMIRKRSSRQNVAVNTETHSENAALL